MQTAVTQGCSFPPAPGAMCLSPLQVWKAKVDVEMMPWKRLITQGQASHSCVGVCEVVEGVREVL